MDYHEFIEEVRQRTGVGATREALVATEATLKTLGERLTELEAVQFAAQLPPEIGRFLTVVDTNHDFDLETFFDHVAQRELIPPQQSRDHALTVLAVLEDWVEPDSLREVLAHLPDDYLNLFSIGNHRQNIERS